MKPEVAVELIKHISKDVEKLTEYVATFRSRIALTVMVGPFVALGSLAISGKNQATTVNVNAWSLLAPIGFLAFTYTAIAIIAARLDDHAFTQTNKWRALILKVVQGKVPLEKEMKMEIIEGDIQRCYIAAFLFTFASFVFLGFLLISAMGIINITH